MRIIYVYNSKCVRMTLNKVLNSGGLIKRVVKLDILVNVFQVNNKDTRTMLINFLLVSLFLIVNTVSLTISRLNCYFVNNFEYVFGCSNLFLETRGVFRLHAKKSNCCCKVLHLRFLRELRIRINKFNIRIPKDI